MVRISTGIVASHLLSGQLPPNDKAVFRVLGLRQILPDHSKASPKSAESSSSQEGIIKYRVAVTDTELGNSVTDQTKFTNGLIIIDESNPPESLPKVNDIVDFASGTTNEKTNSVYVCQGRIVWIIKHFQILSHDQRSNPTTPLHNQSQNSSLSGSPSRGPVKRSQIEAEPSKTPVSAAKRALTFGPSTSSSVVSGDLKATTKIKDLSPYVNKYTILCRVSVKGDLKEISSSRWQGLIFNVTFHDDTGDIQATAFNEDARKFHQVLQTGSAYYVSNARAKSVANARYNRTSHRYELTLNTNTSVVECKAQCNIPRNNFNFQSLQDAADKNDGEKVDVIGMCISSDETREIFTKDGRQVQKRDIKIQDESLDEVTVTLWAENAAGFASPQKVVAFKGATVNEYNGRKNLSLSFGGTLEVEPDHPRVNAIQSWYEGQKDNEGQRSNNSGACKIPPGAIVTLFDVKNDFTLQVGDQTKYYSVDASLISIFDPSSMVYKACPKEGCKKKLKENETNLLCMKCQLFVSKDSYDCCYMIRGVMADISDHSPFVAFDEAGQDIFGKSAAEIQDMKEQDPEQWDKIIHDALYQRFKFRVSVKQEIFNGEARIKFTVLGGQKINLGSDEHIVRLKKGIELLKS